MITRASELSLARGNVKLPRKSEAQRRWLEAPFVALGAAVAQVIELLPAEWALRGWDKVFAALSGGKDYPFDPAGATLTRARALAAKGAREAGRPPALLALISHPPVMGELAHLNFQLVRHACLSLRQIRGGPCRPRLVVAVDPFALDTIPLHEEGCYAGVMGRYHLGLDRLAMARNAASAGLIARTAWPRMAHRLLSVLSGGGEVGLVPAGGVPSTTRALYAAREWASRQRRLSPLNGRPAEMLRRLRAGAAFARFEATGIVTLGSAALLAQAYVMAAVAGVLDEATAQAPAAAEQGRLTPEAAAAAADVLEAFGIEGAARQRGLEEFSRELERETPFRARLFRVLAGRVLRSGRPVLFAPVAHKVGETLSIEERETWLWKRFEGRQIVAEDGRGRSWQGSPEEFAVMFGLENFK